MDINYYLRSRYNGSTKRFETEMYTNVAENVYMDVDSEKTVKEEIESLTQKITNKEPATHTAIITTTWTGTTAPYMQDITVNGILATDAPIVDITLDNVLAIAQAQEKAWGCVSRIVTNDNKITVYCNKKKPTTAIPIQLKVVR